MTADDIKIGRCYRAKKPAIADGVLVNDRQVVWINAPRTKVQYDGPSVKVGQHRPIVDMDKFLKWADRDVTDELPSGEWQQWPVPRSSANGRVDGG